MYLEGRKIERLKERLLNLGHVHPGSITKQFNVCGKLRCKCKDPDNPVKHGPYYQLSYTVAGKSSSRFIKKSELAEAQKRIKRYHELKKLINALTKAYVELSKKTGFERS